jgi:hypothetical protein
MLTRLLILSYSFLFLLCYPVHFVCGQTSFTIVRVDDPSKQINFVIDDRVSIKIDSMKKEVVNGKIIAITDSSLTVKGYSMLNWWRKNYQTLEIPIRAISMIRKNHPFMVAGGNVVFALAAIGLAKGYAQGIVFFGVPVLLLYGIDHLFISKNRNISETYWKGNNKWIIKNNSERY